MEYEQAGQDRAQYGAGLLTNLADQLTHLKGLDERSLRRFRQFYLTYPYLGGAIRGTLSPEFESSMHQSIMKLGDGENDLLPIRGTVFPELGYDTELALRPQMPPELRVPARKILSRLSYSHFELLLNIDDPLKRTFYEIECINGIWSVRDLKRQMNTMYFERSGLSKEPAQLAARVNAIILPQSPKDIVKNMYALDFLDLSHRAIVEEADLESALLDNLQAFILELGNGFCFEARQKRILIGETYYFIDLVFYHRILRCHVLIELKLGEFDHGAIGQLNTYLNYYKREVAVEGDNAPVGILMVAEKDNALVEYAIAGMDQNMFVQKYLINLPSKEQLEKYIEQELRKVR